MGLAVVVVVAEHLILYSVRLLHTSASTRKQVGLGMVIIDRGHPHLIRLGEAVSCDSK